MERSRLFFPKLHQSEDASKLGDVRVMRGTRGGFHDLFDCLLLVKFCIMSPGEMSGGRAGCKYAMLLRAFCNNRVGKTDDEGSGFCGGSSLDMVETLGGGL